MQQNHDDKAILWEWFEKCMTDNVMSDKEREFLLKKAESLGVDTAEFEIELEAEIYRRTHKDPSRTEKQQVTSAENNRKPAKSKLGLIGIISLIVILLCGVLFFKQYRRGLSGPIAFDKYAQDNPELIFKDVSCYKYLIKGTPTDADSHMFKMMAYQVKAVGHYYINMNDLAVDEKTNYSSRELYLTLNSQSYFPLYVDVDIAQNDLVELDNVTPEPVSELEAEWIAKFVSLIAAGVGAIVGSKLGSIIGDDFGTFGKPIGEAVGGVVSSAVIGQKTFVATKNFFIGRQLTSSYELSDEEDFIFSAKQLLAAELLDLNIDETTDMKQLRSKYENEIENQLTIVMKSCGWNSVHVEYVYQDNMYHENH